MGLFFDVLKSINDPNQQGSISQLESITNTVQNLAANQGIGTNQAQSLMAALGGALSPALLQQQRLAGGSQLETLINQVGGMGNGTSALQALFPPQVQQQLAQGIAQKTGLSTNQLLTMLPTLLPAVMGLLNMGASTSNQPGSNALLNAFLDADRSGNTDLGDVWKFANRFLNPPRR